MRIISTFFLSALVTLSALQLATPASSFSQAFENCEKPWVFFDIGNTLIVVQPDPEHPDHFKDLHYIPGAIRYLRTLKRDGFPLGIISNIPAGWGDQGAFKDILDKRTRQLLYTQSQFTQDWKVGAPTFDWSYFGKLTGAGTHLNFDGNVYFPNFTAERKPATCPTCVFNRAFQASQAARCPAVFISKSPAEMEGAEKVGLIPFLLVRDHDEGVYLPPGMIESYVKHYKPGGWKP